MIGLTHNQFIKLFSDLAFAHKNINSFGTGDLWEYMANESDTILPVTLWVVIQAENLQGKTGKPKYTLVVMDAVDKGQENIDEVYSDTKRIAQDLVALLRQPYYESFFTIEQNVVFEPFSEKFDSEMAGHQFDLVFNQPFLYDACEVNIDGLPAVNMDSIYINTSTYAWGNIVGTLSNQTDLQNALNLKQATLVSGTNIKTINGNSVLGSGNLVIATGNETLAQTLALGYNTGGNPIRANNDDPIYLGTDETRYLYFGSASLNPGLTIQNDNSGEFLVLRDSGGIDFSGNLVSMAELGYLSGLSSNAQTQLNSKFPTASFTDTAVTGKLLTGYVSGAGVVASTDSILQAIQKLNGNVGALVTGVSSVNSLTGAVALTGTSNRITISAANVFDISSSYVGQNSITTLGTIGTGTWQGTSISTTYTDAKIKGSTSASNRIFFGSGAANTVTDSANITYDGSTLSVLGSGSDIITVTGSGNGTQRSGIRVNASNSAGQATNYMFNDRNATSSYGGQLYGGTTNSVGNIFGVSRVDKYFIFADGANNLGMGIGTLTAQPVYFGVNNTLAGQFTSAGAFLTYGNNTFGTSAASNQHILNVGSSTAQFIFRERIGATTQGALYLGVASGSELSTNYTLTYNGTTILNSPSTSNAIALMVGGSAALTITPGNTTSVAYYTLATRARTSLTASTNIPTFDVTGNTQTWAAGAITNQYFHYFRANTMAFASGSTATNVYGVFIEPSVAGTNATITNNYALGVNGVSNFLGNVRLTQTVTTEAVTSDTTVTIVINGTTYKLLAKA